MGAKTWMLAYADGDARLILAAKPRLDREAAIALVRQLFPAGKLEPIADGRLSYTCPGDDEIYVGCFPGLSIVAASEFALDHPSKLPRSFIDMAGGRTLYLHAMHSVVDWLAFAKWQQGELVRSLSLAPDNGIIEDIGARLPFEAPYWAGQHPALDPGDEDSDYPFPFHPLDLGGAALFDFFGYQLEGPLGLSGIDPEEIPLLGFKRKRPWWRIW